MKRFDILLICILAFCQLSWALKIGETHQIEHEFCWRDSYGRGVGTIPTDCGNKQLIGLLCYDHCPRDYKRFGFDCHQVCPRQFRDDGLFCRKYEYGRGGGYPWHFGDGLDDHGMFRRCQAQHGRGRCEKWGLVVYPKCKRGYFAAGCCVCRPPPPNCAAYGMNGNVDLSCAKKIIFGAPTSPHCPPGKENQAGLCYFACKKGFYGVGPVCWINTPAGWFNCGMAAAISQEVCATTILGQIGAVAQVAFNIVTTVVTFGGASGVNTAGNVAKGAAKSVKAIKQLKQLKTVVKGSKAFKKLSKEAKRLKKLGKPIKKAYKKSVQASNALDELEQLDDQTVTDADIVRISAQIASLADPTGIASVIESFSQPLCSQIFKKKAHDQEEE